MHPKMRRTKCVRTLMFDVRAVKICTKIIAEKKNTKQTAANSRTKQPNRNFTMFKNIKREWKKVICRFFFSFCLVCVCSVLGRMSKTNPTWLISFTDGFYSIFISNSVSCMSALFLLLLLLLLLLFVCCGVVSYLMRSNNSLIAVIHNTSMAINL